MKTWFVAVVSSTLCMGCLQSADAPDATELAPSAELALSRSARQARAATIRDVAASRGLTNGVLLAGIAEVETGMAHCWSEATWACQGPHSSSCNGPVIAGAADGPCSAQQGGLGMFQFDAGTHSQTLARDGAAILQLDGNIARAVEFVARIVREEVPGLRSAADAIAWMNGIRVVAGDARFEQWIGILACRYNGRCNSSTQAAKYRNATLGALGEFGANFWSVTPPTPRADGGAQGVQADFNGDGLSDVGALYDYPGERAVLFVWLARPEGGFAWPEPWWDSGPGVWEARRSKLFGGDFDGNGLSDVGIVYDYPDSRTVLFTLKAKAGGGFEWPFADWDSGPGQWEAARSKPFSGDFDGDGDGDVGLLYDYPDQRTTAFVWRANDAGVLEGPAVWWDSGPGVWEAVRSKPVTGDFTGDGSTDLALLYDYPDARSVLFVLAAQAAGSFAWPAVWWDSGPGVWEAWRSKLVAGDYNHDGRSDVGLIYDYPNQRTVLFSFSSTGAESFAWPVPVWDSGTGVWEAVRSKPVSGDFNGDGYGDVGLFYDYPGARTVLFSLLAVPPAAFAWPDVGWDSGEGVWEQARTNPL